MEEDRSLFLVGRILHDKDSSDSGILKGGQVSFADPAVDATGDVDRVKRLIEEFGRGPHVVRRIVVHDMLGEQVVILDKQEIPRLIHPSFFR